MSGARRGGGGRKVARGARGRSSGASPKGGIERGVQGDVIEN